MYLLPHLLSELRLLGFTNVLQPASTKGLNAQSQLQLLCSAHPCQPHSLLSCNRHLCSTVVLLFDWFFVRAAHLEAACDMHSGQLTEAAGLLKLIAASESQLNQSPSSIADTPLSLLASHFFLSATVWSALFLVQHFSHQSVISVTSWSSIV